MVRGASIKGRQGFSEIMGEAPLVLGGGESLVIGEGRGKLILHEAKGAENVSDTNESK